jgi:predicted AAA+ superfamily ATPase
LKLSKYFALDWELFYAQTKEGAEIDLVITRPGQPLLLIEIKSKEIVSKEDAKTLETLGNEYQEPTEKWLLSRDPVPQDFGSTKAIYWLDALKSHIL